MTKICPIHNIKLGKRYNSNFYIPCPKCEIEKLYGAKKSEVRERVRKKSKSPSDRTRAMKKADLWFSRYIRLKYHYMIDEDGTVYCRCIVNGKPYPANRVDNGHYISRSKQATRYDVNNCRPQNRSSNRYRGEADKDKFMVNLIKEIGQENYDRLLEKSRKVIDVNAVYFNTIADHYKKLTNELLKELNAKKWW